MTERREGSFVPRGPRGAARALPSAADILARRGPAKAPVGLPGRPTPPRRQKGGLAVPVANIIAQASAQAEREAFWRGWLGEQLPDIKGCIVHIAEQPGQLTLYANSAAMAARLRYAVVEIQDALKALDGPRVTVIRVRVMPQGGAR